MKHQIWSNLVVLVILFTLSILSTYTTISQAKNVKNNTITKPLPSPSTITKQFIDQICLTTNNSSLCHEVLGGQLGKQTLNPIYLLANRLLIEAKYVGERTREAAVSFYSTVIDPTKQVRDEYRRCLVAYRDAISFLDKASQFRRRFNYRDLKSYVSSAGNRVKSCETNNLKRITNFKSISEATEKFRGLCSITTAICDYPAKQG